MGGRDVWHFQGPPKASFLHARFPQCLATLQREHNGRALQVSGSGMYLPPAPGACLKPASLSTVPGSGNTFFLASVTIQALDCNIFTAVYPSLPVPVEW